MIGYSSSALGAFLRRSIIHCLARPVLWPPSSSLSLRATHIASRGYASTHLKLALRVCRIGLSQECKDDGRARTGKSIRRFHIADRRASVAGIGVAIIAKLADVEDCITAYDLQLSERKRGGGDRVESKSERYRIITSLTPAQLSASSLEHNLTITILPDPATLKDSLGAKPSGPGIHLRLLPAAVG